MEQRPTTFISSVDIRARFDEGTQRFRISVK